MFFKFSVTSCVDYNVFEYFIYNQWIDFVSKAHQLEC